MPQPAKARSRLSLNEPYRTERAAVPARWHASNQRVFASNGNDAVNFWRLAHVKGLESGHQQGPQHHFKRQVHSGGMVIAQTLSEFVGARTMSTILLVDDDVDSLWLLQTILEGRGHHILMAEGGEVALEKAGRYLPDLIVTDWNMPGVDGIALCERLKWYPALALIPVVMTSGQFPPKEKSTLWNVFLS